MDKLNKDKGFTRIGEIIKLITTVQRAKVSWFDLIVIVIRNFYATNDSKDKSKTKRGRDPKMISSW